MGLTYWNIEGYGIDLTDIDIVYNDIMSNEFEDDAGLLCEEIMKNNNRMTYSSGGDCDDGFYLYFPAMNSWDYKIEDLYAITKEFAQNCIADALWPYMDEDNMTRDYIKQKCDYISTQGCG